MKAGWNRRFLFMAALLLLAGCRKPGDMSVVMKTTKGETLEESSQAPVSAKTEEEVSEDPLENRTEEEETIGDFGTGVRCYIGMKGHVKEVQEDRVLISSDTDDFPGVFWVYGAQKLAAPEELKGGLSVFVLMEDMKEKGEDGIDRYRAEKYCALPPEENQGRHDIILTDAPAFMLTDVLSSVYDPYEIKSGNYMWDSRENGVGGAQIACGSAPLEEAAMKIREPLKLPSYQGTDSVGYSFSTTIQPDKLVVRQWPAEDIGKEEAETECIFVYYHVVPFLDLKPGKVYEFTAEWKKENQEQYKFSGNASYVLVTE